MFSRVSGVAKIAAWKRFISPRDSWGKPYRLLKALTQRKSISALKGPDGRYAQSAEENAELLLAAKFDGPPLLPADEPQYLGPIGPAPRVTAQEVAQIVKRLNISPACRLSTC